MAKIENSTTPKVGVIMGSVSDWETMKEACDVLEQLQVAFEKKVVSAHRTPQWLTKYAEDAEGRGLQVIICLLYTSPSPRDISGSRMPSSA